MHLDRELAICGGPVIGQRLAPGQLGELDRTQRFAVFRIDQANVGAAERERLAVEGERSGAVSRFDSTSCLNVMRVVAEVTEDMRPLAELKKLHLEFSVRPHNIEASW